MKHQQVRMAMLPKIEYPYQKILRLIQRYPEKLYMRRYQGLSNCGTTCCIAGWTIALGGHEAMRRYWMLHGPRAPIHAREEMLAVADYAADLLRRASGDVPLPDFFSSNKKARKALHRAAQKEKEIYGVLDYYWSPEVMFDHMQLKTFSRAHGHEMFFSNPQARQ